MLAHRLTAYFAETRRVELDRSRKKSRHFAMIPAFALAAIGAAAMIYAHAYAQAERQILERRRREAASQAMQRARHESYRWN